MFCLQLNTARRIYILYEYKQYKRFFCPHAVKTVEILQKKN